jgi:predicted permease
MHSILQDLRYGLRQLRKSPSFTLTAILTLAFGIGATTALFSVVDGVLLKPLAYRDSGRLVVIWEKVRFLEQLFPYVGANARHEDIWSRQSTAFSDLTLLKQASTGVSLGTSDHPRLVGRIIAQPNLLDILSVQPVLGRNFLPEEAVKGHEQVAIISWHLSQTLFNGDSGVIGKSVLINGTPNQVVGVLPKNFYFPKANELAPIPLARQLPDNEIFTPLVIDPTKSYGWNTDYGNYVALGRLKPGVSLTQATENLNAVDNYIAHQIPPDQLRGPVKGALAAYVQPMKEVIVGKTAARLWLLMAAVFSVLLIACINLANAQLARLVSRDREAAVRSALGASASRILQSALAEVLLLSVTGGILGVALAFLAVHQLTRYTELAIPRTQTISVNFTVLALSILLTVGATFICGVLPALRLLRVKPLHALQGAKGSLGSRRSALLRRWLVGAQVFACTTLLLIAGLFAKSLAHLSTFDKGFSTDHVISADVYLQGNAFGEDKDRAGFDDGILAKLRTLSGVKSVSLISYMILTGDSWIDGVTPADRPHDSVLANYRWIGLDYFATMQQHIVEGRAIDEHDRIQKNAVISEATAKAVWPNQSPLGRQFLYHDKPVTIVGVVADAHSNSLRDAPVNMVYMPYWDNPPYSTYFLIRTTQDPQLLTEEIRKAIWSYNPNVTIARIHTLDSQVSDSLAPEHLETGIFVAFGAAALLLALLGIYGTLSYSVEARTQEVGIRMALGATRESVYRLMLVTIIAPVTIGLALGCLTSISIGRSLASLLYGTKSTDLTVIIPVVAIFAIAAVAATFVPCSRAAKIEPMEALRAE